MKMHAIRCLTSFGCLVLFLQDGVCARLEVMLDSDPRINASCSQSATDIVISAMVTSALYNDEDEVFVYQAGFHRDGRGGVLLKRSLALAGGDRASATSKPIWNAADLINEKDRKIYTSTINQAGALVTIPFVWERLSAQQKNYLNQSPATHAYDGLGSDRLLYLRGAAEVPGGLFRKRDSLLGAIVHSTPVLLDGYPPDGSGQQHPTDIASQQPPVILVAANDGALHAFNADNGQELFAFIPNFLFPRLAALTDKSMPYRPSMDGAMTVADANVGGQWKTILLATAGAGAQGLFALDVSDAEQFDTGGGVLWEFSDADDPDLGNVIATPGIAKFRIEAATGVISYRYFAVIAGGLNNYRSDGSGKNTANTPNNLFLLALDKPNTDPWVAGENYFKMPLPSGDAGSANGLTAATAILDNAGAVHYLYLTDLQGNIWRIDFYKNTPWRSGRVKSRQKPVFSARDGTGNRQPITQAPLVLFASKGYLLLFGTGKYMESSDAESSSFKVQTFYGVRDSLSDTLNAKENTGTRAQLSQRVLSSTVRADHALAINSRASSIANRGWYLDFLDSDQSGERSISPASAIGGKVFFNTLIPAISPCAKNHGRAYVLDSLTGLSLTTSRIADQNLTGTLSDTGVWLPPIILQSTTPMNEDRAAGSKAENKDRSKNRNTAESRRVRKIVRLRSDEGEANGSMDESSTTQEIPLQSVVIGGRLSWREIVNWSELHQAAIRGQ